MSHQVGSLHRSISHPANLQNNLSIVPLFAFPHLNHLILTPHPAWNQTLIPTQQCKTLSPISSDEFANSEPSSSTLTHSPFQPIHSQVKTEPFSPPSPISIVTPVYSHLTSEPSDNNDSENTQISQELDNFITLEQQLQHPQTLTIHQLSRSIISSNPTTPIPSSNYTPSQNPTPSLTLSSSTTRAYRTFKRKFPSTPLPSNPGTFTSFVNHPLHTNTKEFLQNCLPFFPQYTYIQTPMKRNPFM